MDQCVDEVNPPSPTNDTDFVKHLDVNVFIKSGKWVAKIWHPIRKVWVCLGIYSNHEEAADAYTRKKLQYESESLQEMGALFHTNVADTEKHPGVRRCTPSGKWRARIKHKKVTVYLGSYNTPNEAVDAYNLSKLELQSPKISSLRKIGVSVDLDLQFEAAEAADHENCKLDSGVGSTIMCRESVGLENDLELQYVGSSSLKGGITQAVSSPCAAAHIRGVGGRGSVYQQKSGKWKAEIQLSKVRHKLGTYATAEDAREALNQKKCELGLTGEDAREALNWKKCELCLKIEDAQEALNQKKCEVGLKVDAEQSERNQRRRHAYVRKSGRWQTEIRHPLTKAKKIYLGTFDTAEEAEDAYNSMRRHFELMFPDYMNRKQLNERVHLGTLTEEAKESYKNKMREIDLMVCAHRKPKQSKGSCEADAVGEGKSDSTRISENPFASGNGSSVIKAVRGEDAGGSMINVNVESGSGFVTEETGDFDLDVIDSYGRFVDEYSRMDDELWI